ncbi:MAG: hypothetical protein MJ225_03660 [Bacilli bacterium]|nr:hypothetical protein [Bacilli bacterium]
MKELVIVAGAAGSGLSSAEFIFEELGYITIKNIPTQAWEALTQLEEKEEKSTKTCLICHAFNVFDIISISKKLKHVDVKIILLTCDKESLLKRYALSRRVHPRTTLEKITPEQAIEKDCDDIKQCLDYANLVIDTSAIQVKRLRTLIYQFISGNKSNKITAITFMSFGLKNGVPEGIDTFFDVRQIPNPYWVDKLKELTGEDQEVIDYMNSFPITQKTIDSIIVYLESFFNELQKSDRANYTIGIACSGGQHRSTYVANYLKKYFEKKYTTFVIHRDSPQLNSNEE